MPTEFTQDQFEALYPDNIERHWWHVARNRIVLRQVRRLMPPGAGILDIGCGRGIAVKALREAGLSCQGVEFSVTRSLPGLEAHITFGADATTLPLATRRAVGVILLLDVIEHIAEPVPFLRSLAAAFPEASDAVVTVPARPELWSDFDRFNGHYRRYTLPMIRELARDAQWTLTSSSYFFRPLYPPIRMFTVSKRRRELHVAAPSWGLWWLHRILAAAMVADFLVMPARVPGSSIIATFRLRAAA